MLVEVTTEEEFASAVELPRVVALQPAIAPLDLVLDEPELELGRGPACDVVIPFGWVSRLHAQLLLIDGRYHVRDRRSSNGTYVNGQRIERPHRLVNHDLIGLGEVGPHLTFVDIDATECIGAQLEYDERTMRFALHGTPLDLTPNQFRLLRHLHRESAGVCSREALAEAVWGADYAPGMEATTLDRLVSTLRGALRRVDRTCTLIATRPGIGYALVDPGAAAAINC